jgi:hypothetical protein
MRKLLIIFLISVSLEYHLRFNKFDANKIFKGIENIETLSDTAKSIGGFWQSLTGAFKTKNSHTIKKYANGKGFSHFMGNFDVRVNLGVVEKYYDKYFESKMLLLGVPSNKKDMFIDAVQDAKMMDKHIWTNMDLVFNPSGKEIGTVKGVSLMVNKRKNKKFDVIITDMNARFKVAPDIFLEETNKSIAGGIFEGQKQRLITKPKSLSEQELKALLDMYKLLSFKILCDVFGIEVSLPNF